MVSVFLSGSSDLGLSNGWGHRVVFLSKPLYFHSASLCPGVSWVLGNLILGITK